MKYLNLNRGIIAGCIINGLKDISFQTEMNVNLNLKDIIHIKVMDKDLKVLITSTRFIETEEEHKINFYSYEGKIIEEIKEVKQ